MKENNIKPGTGIYVPIHLLDVYIFVCIYIIAKHIGIYIMLASYIEIYLCGLVYYMCKYNNGGFFLGWHNKSWVYIPMYTVKYLDCLYIWYVCITYICTYYNTLERLGHI